MQRIENENARQRGKGAGLNRAAGKAESGASRHAQCESSEGRTSEPSAKAGRTRSVRRWCRAALRRTVLQKKCSAN